MGNALVEFYPTPKTLIDKMLDGIDFNTILWCRFKTPKGKCCSH